MDAEAIGKMLMETGKYKNQPIEQAANDAAYVKWVQAHTSKDMPKWAMFHAYCDKLKKEEASIQATLAVMKRSPGETNAAWIAIAEENLVSVKHQIRRERPASVNCHPEGDGREPKSEDRVWQQEIKPRRTLNNVGGQAGQWEKESCQL